MILTVTLNVALDVTYAVDVLRPGESHRVRSVHRVAGGKGINVARILHAFGHDVLVTGMAGGTTGAAVVAELDLAGVPVAFVPIANETRRTVSLVSAASGDATLFNEPGPVVGADEWSAMEELVARLGASAAVTVMSGSLPPGVPSDAYARLVRRARASGSMTLIDADGQALGTAVEAHPDLVTPNRAELQAATGVEDPLVASAWLRDRGAAAVVATLGSDGLIAVTPDGTWAVRLSRELQAVNPTGAGDACAAALAAGMEARRSWPEMLVDAVAWSAASVRAPVAGEVDTAELDRIRRWVVVEELDAPRLHR